MEPSATRLALIARRRQVEAIFEQAADLPPAAQAELLADRCAGDPLLRAEVETLLRHDGAARAGLEALVGQAAAAAGGSADCPGGPAGLAGAVLGHWRLVRELGQGGMGAVWLGERIAGDFDQQVAIKLIRPGLESAHLVQRFAAERRILAGLIHPSIARLYDGGAGPGGRPYLVMEYVEGRPLTAAAAEWPLARKLALFLAVADAVAYAHRNLVVHRDLKPGNVLVTAEGAPKLLDFGIAKLLDPDQEKTQTAAGLFAFSPEYASPEQVMGEPITTATDVYSLGLLLFELLTGQKAQPVTTLSPVALYRAVCEAEKPRPSAAAPALRRELAGDLDAIVAKALRREGEARYANAAELADDLRRHLAKTPVRARRRTFLYRAGLFVRRHRAAVVAAALVMLSLLGGLFATAWQAGERAREARLAERRFAQVRGLATRFLFDFDRAVGKLAGSTEVRKMVVSTAVEHLDALAADAAGDRGLELELAQAYVRLARVQGSMDAANLGERREALASLDKGLELAGRAAEGTRPDYLEAMALVHLEKAIVFASLGREDAMLAEIGAGLEFSRRVTAGEASDSGKRIHSSLLLRLADLCTARGEPAAARAALEEARRLESKDVGTTLARLGLAAREEGDLAASLVYFEAARAAAAIRSDQCQIEADLGRTLDDPDLPSLSRSEDAMAAAERGIACAEELAAADPRDVRAAFALLNTLGAGGSIYAAAAPQRSLASLERARQVLGTVESLAPQAIDLELERALLAVARALPLSRLGRAAEAERELAAAAPILAAHAGDRDDVRAADAAWLAALRRGELREAAGRPAAAAEEYQEALALARRGRAARPARPRVAHLEKVAGERRVRLAGNAKKAPAGAPR
jgi:predicted Ser/Thr protein kinase